MGRKRKPNEHYIARDGPSKRRAFIKRPLDVMLPAKSDIHSALRRTNLGLLSHNSDQDRLFQCASALSPWPSAAY